MYFCFCVFFLSSTDPTNQHEEVIKNKIASFDRLKQTQKYKYIVNDFYGPTPKYLMSTVSVVSVTFNE